MSSKNHPISKTPMKRHGNVKVDSNLVKSGGFALPITGLKSEIRISKCETISKFENQMTKTFRDLMQYLQDFFMF